MSLEVRKYTAYSEELHKEMGRQVDQPILMVAAAAIIQNPWAGQGYVDDLRPTILEIAPKLGNELVERLLGTIGRAEDVEAYGKAALVGINGEIEHGSGIIHTLRFGNIFREAVGGTAFLNFTNARGGAGHHVSIPMAHKTDAGFRSHYLTIEFTVADAPGPDEMIVALGAATGGRAFPRIGNRYEDMKEMGLEPNG
ncbi:amino acid synthesis family protein [Fodinicurvata halophila]|uniref:Amino acid synthesis family protein n=1 Tax=Fodinicurvata halophila TaxID=1419723 RepID=A0ABV8UMP7_9PROT